MIKTTIGKELTITVAFRIPYQDYLQVVNLAKKRQGNGGKRIKLSKTFRYLTKLGLEHASENKEEGTTTYDDK
jgi:hypothetical protein